MHLAPFLALNFVENGMAILAALVVAVVVVLLFILIMSRYTKVGPNQVLVVSGRKHRLEDGSVVGFRIVKGGGTFVWPVLEKVDVLSLELLTIDVQTPEVYTSKGVPVKVDGVAQIKVKGDDISIRHRGGTISRARPRTKSRTSPRKRSKVICAPFSAR